MANEILLLLNTFAQTTLKSIHIQGKNAQRHPKDTQNIPKIHPNGSQKALKRHPKGTQKTP